jgi:ClpP class serine protease
MDPKAIGFSYMWTGIESVTCTDDGLAIIKINGPLEHHRCWYWDSYEAILHRLQGAMTGEIFVEQHNARCWWDDVEPMPPGSGQPAKAVVLAFDSPGGEAAGATYAHRRIRALRDQYGVPIYSYANEGAASAAYELACAADEIWLPDTGVVGSIGVIATVFDTMALGEKTGVHVELITSGDEKADYHADRELTDDIRGRIKSRVMELATVFWDVVAEARGTTRAAVAALNAGTFCGQTAVDVGVADGVADWDSFLENVTRSITDPDVLDTEDAAQ